MRLAVVVALLLLVAGCQSPPSQAAAHAPVAVDAVWEQVAFLTGCWRRTSGDEVSEEIWTPPHGDTMYGQNRMLRRGELVFFELLTIERRGDELVYVARPRGQSPVEFPLHEASGDAVTFRNPQHDFPKRIHYAVPDGATGNGTLRATVDGGDDQPRSAGVLWQRVR